MGNSFIGFPVPRAKIADMIATDAPPTLHNENHESGGKDEIDCTGLVGAGGIALPLDDFYFDTFFVNKDRWHCVTNGTGTVTFYDDYSKVSTGATAGALAKIYKEIDYPLVPLTWEKERILKIAARIYSLVDNICDCWIGSGSPTGNEFIGFKVTAGKLYSRCLSSAGETVAEIMDLGASAYTVTLNLKCHLQPGVRCDFWVDGVQRDAITTNLPTGDGDADEVISIRIENPGSNNDKRAQFSHSQLWQEA